MAIPKYHELMYPILFQIQDGGIYTLKDIKDRLANQFKLSSSEIRELLPSGHQEIFYNRLGWARTYLKKAGLVEYVERGQFRITESGLNEIKSDINKITPSYLTKYDSFNEFRSSKIATNPNADNADETPDETFEKYFLDLDQNLKSELLEKITNNSPEFFENLVVDVLLNLGYGGTTKEAKTTLRSNDEGIDGIINEDRLGLDIIYIQAKRWKKESSVGRPEIQKFAGALQGKRAKKGVFITTGSFSKTAKDYVKNIDSKIVLIDGDSLTKLMVENNIGVYIKQTYHIKEIDTDYFVED